MPLPFGEGRASTRVVPQHSSPCSRAAVAARHGVWPSAPQRPVARAQKWLCASELKLKRRCQQASRRCAVRADGFGRVFWARIRRRKKHAGTRGAVSPATHRACMRGGASLILRACGTCARRQGSKPGRKLKRTKSITVDTKKLRQTKSAVSHATACRRPPRPWPCPVPQCPGVRPSPARVSCLACIRRLGANTLIGLGWIAEHELVAPVPHETKNMARVRVCGARAAAARHGVPHRLTRATRVWCWSSAGAPPTRRHRRQRRCTAPRSSMRRRARATS